MPVSIVVGGQFGSEGKGKVAAWLAGSMGAALAVRCGGSNAGHTVYGASGEKRVFRHLPTACINGASRCALAAGSYIDLAVLDAEIAQSGIGSDRLSIDPQAVIITADDIDAEQCGGLAGAIGSTASGTGAAVMKRLSRNRDVTFAEDIPALAPYIRDTKTLFDEALRGGERVIIEGTQGYGLSAIHSEHYPFVTARDTTAAGFLSECGISPLYVDDICLVIRAFPIRVAGNSGPLPNEISWDTIAEEAGLDEVPMEYTSVTGKIRRVARFDPEIVRQSIAANSPTRIVLNHVDYIRADLQERFVAEVASSIGRGIDYVGRSPRSVAEFNRGNAPKLRVV